jgi:TRAP-type C4-dicarboxylate transport system permease small subunit
VKTALYKASSLGPAPGSRMVRLTLAASDGANWLVERLLILAGGVICLILFAQVVSRYLGASLGWSEEVSRHLLVAITFLGATAAYKRADFIGLRGVGQWVGNRGEQFILTLLQLLTLCCFGLLSWFGVLYTIKAGNHSTAALQIPMSIPFSVIPLSAAIMVLHCIADILRSPRNDRGSKSDPGVQ